MQSKTVICLTTHNRIDCARINLEIIKLNYNHTYPVVHACSGSGYSKYLEDIFISCEARNLREGALNLLQESIITAINAFNPEYIVHLESDTWILDENVIHRLIKLMDNNRRYILCTSKWDIDRIERAKPTRTGIVLRIKKILANPLRLLGIPYGISFRKTLATQFFIMRTTPKMIKMILNLDQFEGDILEACLYNGFFRSYRKRNLLRLRNREPVHPKHRYISEAYRLYSQHWPAKGTAHDQREPSNILYISPHLDGKKDTLLKYSRIRNGENIQKLILAENFDYYNPGASRT